MRRRSRTSYGSLSTPEAGDATRLPNRFDKVHAERDLEQVADDAEFLDGLDDRKVEYLADASRTIVSENDSPDIPFTYSVNPYRGCAHG